ncbi:aminoglycoside phosphotransferase family protein [Streptomyces antnestii]|uniref:Aminoglycoside phosphotransferase family protein n=1 Tax=Streptomyces antnestii TaxID=2494256 RepID=A0A3S2Z3L3_9ACTN|nr:aminoglycoside phosphotransferase family protein [Streptomyces sp. San01]RVU28540.1 aminoglycoside phosphotransferase family protein [Streptomyces sp. San01]
MSDAPRPTQDTVHRLLGTLFPDGGRLEVAPVTEGGDHSTWWAGTRYVLRFALDAPSSARMRREIRLRDLVRQHVGVAVPASLASGEWTSGLTYTLDTRLQGASGDAVDVTAAGEEDLAGLLGGLRAVPAARAETLGLRRTPPRSLDVLRREAGRAAERLGADGEFEPARLAQFTAHAAAQLAPQPGAVVVHHDLKGEHLTVTPDGRVRGALDWADAVIGDPAEDIAGLAVAVGSRAAVRAATLAGYGARASLRGLWLARCDTLVRLAGRLYGTDDSPLPLLRTQLDRAWEAILLELVTELSDKDPDLS